MTEGKHPTGEAAGNEREALDRTGEASQVYSETTACPEVIGASEERVTDLRAGHARRLRYTHTATTIIRRTEAETRASRPNREGPRGKSGNICAAGRTLTSVERTAERGIGIGRRKQAQDSYEGDGRDGRPATGPACGRAS